MQFINSKNRHSKEGFNTMNIVVLAGGTSTERDISIVSGTMVCRALRNKGHKAVVVDVFLGYKGDNCTIDSIYKEQQDLDANAENLKAQTKSVAVEFESRKKKSQSFFGENVLALCESSDIVFMGLHGANGEDGKIQAAFDLLGIKYTGTGYLSSAISMNKQLTKIIVSQYKVPMPKGVEVVKSEGLQECTVGFPCVVKPCCGGSSVGVSIANNAEEYKKALEDGFALEESLVVEQFIDGREFSIGVIEGEALPIIEIAPLEGFYDYTNKYKPGATKDTCPAQLNADITIKMQRYAEMACEAVGLETYGRVDFLIGKDEEIYCLEINTLPGMTPTSLLPQEAAVNGYSFDALCEWLVEVSMKKYN